MEGKEVTKKEELGLTRLRRETAKSPKYDCSNCGCKRYSPCGCQKKAN